MTAAVIELSFSVEPRYSGEWVSEASIERIEAYIEANQDKYEVVRYARAFRSLVEEPGFSPGGPITPIPETLAELAPYCVSGGQYAPAVARICIGLDLPVLRAGAVLVDTPGLNEVTRVREFLALEEARKADCLLFVLRADKIGTESERRFLSGLVIGGRVLHLIPVMTHLDRLDSDDDRNRAIAEAERLVKNTVFATGQRIEVQPMIGLNAASAGDKPEAALGNADFAALQQRLRQAIDDPGGDDHFQARLVQAMDELEAHKTAAVDRWLSGYDRSLPDVEFTSRYEEMSNALGELAGVFAQEIELQLAGTRDKMRGDADRFANRMYTVRRECIAQLRDDVTATIEAMDGDFTDPARWEALDRRVEGELRRAISTANNARADELREYDDDGIRFKTNISRSVDAYASRLQDLVASFEIQAVEHDELVGHLLHAHGALKNLDRQVVAATLGYVAGKAGAGGWFDNGIARNLMESGLKIAGAVMATKLGGMVLGRFMNVKKRKAQFVDSKVENVKSVADEIIDPLVEQDQARVEAQWEDVVSLTEHHFSPLLIQAFGAAIESRLTCDVLRRVREDGPRFADSVRAPSRARGTVQR